MVEKRVQIKDEAKSAADPVNGSALNLDIDFTLAGCSKIVFDLIIQFFVYKKGVVGSLINLDFRFEFLFDRLIASIFG